MRRQAHLDRALLRAAHRQARAEVQAAASRQADEDSVTWAALESELRDLRRALRRELRGVPPGGAGVIGGHAALQVRGHWLGLRRGQLVRLTRGGEVPLRAEALLSTAPPLAADLIGRAWMRVGWAVVPVWAALAALLGGLLAALLALPLGPVEGAASAGLGVFTLWNVLVLAALLRDGWGARRAGADDRWAVVINLLVVAVAVGMLALLGAPLPALLAGLLIGASGMALVTGGLLLAEDRLVWARARAWQALQRARRSQD